MLTVLFQLILPQIQSDKHYHHLHLTEEEKRHTHGQKVVELSVSDTKAWACLAKR